MDWKNRLEQIRNKLKLQFHAKGVDNLHQLQKVFDVSNQSFDKINPIIDVRRGQIWHLGQVGV